MTPALSDARRALLALLEERLARSAAPAMAATWRSFTGIVDRDQRRRKLLGILDRSCDRMALLLIRDLWARGREPLARELLLDLMTTRPLTESLGYDRVRDLYRRVRDEGDLELARLFLAPASALDTPERETEDNEKMVSVALGIRKAYARGTDRMRLDRLRFDRNPQVIRNLLNNPRVVERDVVQIAARRPNQVAVLEEIVRSQRWIVRYPVKIAIVRNPYTPADMALPLLPHLHRQDLREIARQPTLDPVVRNAARRLLQR